MAHEPKHGTNDPALRRQRLIVAGVLALAVIGLAAHALSYAFISDDAYITFRYSWNLAFHGDPSFNLGQRVEGYTNFLWMALLALLLKIGLRPEVTSQALGIVAGGAVVVLLYLLTRLYRGGRRTPWDVLGAVVLPTLGGFAIWCSGGLETQLFAALALGGMVTYVAESGGHVRLRYSGGIFALAAMTRPEGLLLFGLTGLHRLGRNLLVERRLWPRAEEVAWVCGFIIPFGLFFWWRMGFYGHPFPNTYYVKAGGNHVLMLKKWGLPYLWDFIHLNRLYVFAPFLLMFWPRTSWSREAAAARRAVEVKGRAREAEEQATPPGDWLAQETRIGAVLLAEEAPAVEEAPAEEETPPVEEAPAEEETPAVEEAPGAATLRPAFVWSYLAMVIVTFVAYVCWVGGDFMANGRFFVPVLPLLLFVGQEALREAFERPRGARAADSWRLSRFAPVLALLLVGGVLNAVWVHRINAKLSYRRWGLDTVAYLRKFADDRVAVGRWLRKRVPPDTYLAVGGAGAIVYASRLKALDTFGLNDAWIAHNVRNHGGRPGHSKSAPDHYIFSQKPDLMCHRARHQDWPYRPSAGEAAMWRARGYRWVCIDPRGLRPRYYCCLKRLDKDLGVWPAEPRR